MQQSIAAKRLGDWTIYASQYVDVHHASGLIVRLYRRGGAPEFFNVPDGMEPSVRDRLAKGAENALVSAFGLYPDDI